MQQQPLQTLTGHRLTRLDDIRARHIAAHTPQTTHTKRCFYCDDLYETSAEGFRGTCARCQRLLMRGINPHFLGKATTPRKRRNWLTKG